MSESNKQSRRHAVVVGINDYSGSPMTNLNFCSNDAEAFYEALIHYAHYDEKDMVLFSDGAHTTAEPPTYTDILSAINEMCERAGDGDSILLFFAGHGTRDENDSYLLTKEYRRNVLSDSSIAMSKVNGYFETSKAKFKLRFFDACHSGRMGVRGLPNPNVEGHLAVTAEGWATLASCREDQFAHEVKDIKQGIFSYFIVKGLSGDASVDDAHVTLDNLKVYVMDNTIDLSKKLGLEQTPVFSGEQAGSLILSRVTRKVEEGLPAALVKISKVVPDQLEPAANDTETLLNGILERLTRRSDTFAFISPGQEVKTELVSKFAAIAYGWAEARVRQDNDKLPARNLFSVERMSIQKHPFNRQLGSFLSTSKAGRALEWEYVYESVTRTREVPVRESYGYALGREVTRYVKENYEEDVVGGVKEVSENSESAIVITFRPQERAFPYCSMTTSFIPSTFGIYSICFFASTQLIKEMKEQWNGSSFSVRSFIAIPIREWEEFDLESWLNNLHAQFVSYITESIDARQRALAQLGAAPNTPLA